MKSKVLFITPPYHAGVVEVAGRWVPLNLVYIAGAARKAGFECVIYDAMTKNVGYKEIEAKIREVRPRFVASSAKTCTLPDAIKVLETAKSIDPSITTILGGIHPTFMYEEVFSLTKAVDFIVRGEGEETIGEFLKAFDSGKDHSTGSWQAISSVKGLAYMKDGSIVVTADRPLMSSESLDKLEKAWDLLDWSDYRYFVIHGSRLGALDTSRGCDKECTFCSQRKFWQKSWRSRSPESLIEDIRVQKEEFGVNVVLLTDDYPTHDRIRWERFLDLLIKEDMGIYLLMETRVEDILRDRDILPKYRKAGIIHIYVGTEATNQETLELFKKEINVEDSKLALRLLNDHGIITETSMILGLPSETKDSIEKTLRLAIEYNPDFCHFLAIAPWPYADIYEDLKSRIKVFDYKKYNLIDPIIEPDAMTLVDIDKAIVDCYRRFYMGKMKEVSSLKDEFKRNYMLEAMRLMMTNSFLVNKIGDLGRIPEEVAKYISSFKTHGGKAAV